MANGVIINFFDEDNNFVSVRYSTQKDFQFITERASDRFIQQALYWMTLNQDKVDKAFNLARRLKLISDGHNFRELIAIENELIDPIGMKMTVQTILDLKV